MENPATPPQTTHEETINSPSPLLSRLPQFCRKPAVLIGSALVVMLALTPLLLKLSSAAPRASFDMELTVSSALSFAKAAQTSPSDAIFRYCSPQAALHFKIIGERIWQTVSPELGWRWLFQGALMTVASPVPEGLTNGAIVGWYHPWSDTALLTLWAISNASAKIADCEFVMGDILRKRNLAKPSTTRAWARRRQYFAAALGLTTAESLRSIELLTYASNLPALTNLAATQQPAWRQRLPFILSPSNLEANHIGAGVMLLSAIGDIIRFSAPTNVFAIRVAPTLQQLHSPSNLLTIGAGAAATIKSLPQDFLSRFVPAFYANSRQRAFLMLQAKNDPKRCLAFLFSLEPPEKEDAASKDEARQDDVRLSYVSSLDSLEETETNEAPEQMYPEAYYPIKLIRADLLDLGAVYSNRYPVQRSTR